MNKQKKETEKKSPRRKLILTKIKIKKWKGNVGVKN